MFGLSFEHLLILLVAALFILGPDKLPQAAAWLARAVKQVRDYASGAKEQMRSELGPEFDELRKPLEDLNALRNLNPKAAVTRYLLDDNSALSGLGNSLNMSGTTAAGVSTADQLGSNGHQVEPPRQPQQPLQPGQRPPFDPDAT
ncbi:Sec-independent protein translocase subunit TatB [Solihabitans fulvus]|uniref:Sec-independent protein translocase protein TatB n=1 Tax=Solihabitans fulvus TaxID=1892852 RepID=A0A5B2WMN5_9PSEU|nr:Sec-independent protein translocase protein TatB [Solihabitans fulvus]KAA2252695.1 Sec-independent protein translocase subunit TatB [Solihabitans fulvus]